MHLFVSFSLSRLVEHRSHSLSLSLSLSLSFSLSLFLSLCVYVLFLSLLCAFNFHSWVQFFNLISEKAKKLPWLHLSEALKLGFQCQMQDELETLYALSYLHEQGRVLHIASDPTLKQLVLLQPSKAMVEPVARFICDFKEHHIPQHREAIRSQANAWELLTEVWAFC
jgi:hypothetical protein